MECGCLLKSLLWLSCRVCQVWYCIEWRQAIGPAPCGTAKLQGGAIGVLRVGVAPRMEVSVY